MLVKGLAKVTLFAQSDDQLSQAVAFYSALGFKVIFKAETHVDLHFFSAAPVLSFSLVIQRGSTEPSGLKQDETLKLQFYAKTLVQFEDWLKQENLEYVKCDNTCADGARSMSIEVKDPLSNTIVVSNDKALIAHVAKDVNTPAMLPSKAQIHLLKYETVLDSTACLLSKPKRNIGILTSGGDSSGMNAAVRAITRYALTRECQPFAIFEGYNGLVEGGDKIKQLGWEDVRGLLSVVSSSFVDSHDRLHIKNTLFI